jgi:hypothetical protein
VRRVPYLAFGVCVLILIVGAQLPRTIFAIKDVAWRGRRRDVAAEYLSPRGGGAGCRRGRRGRLERLARAVFECLALWVRARAGNGCTLCGCAMGGGRRAGTCSGCSLRIRECTPYAPLFVFGFLLPFCFLPFCLSSYPPLLFTCLPYLIFSTFPLSFLSLRIMHRVCLLLCFFPFHIFIVNGGTVSTYVPGPVCTPLHFLLHTSSIPCNYLFHIMSCDVSWPLLSLCVCGLEVLVCRYSMDGLRFIYRLAWNLDSSESCQKQVLCMDCDEAVEEILHFPAPSILLPYRLRLRLVRRATLEPSTSYRERMRALSTMGATKIPLQRISPNPNPNPRPALVITTDRVVPRATLPQKKKKNWRGC